MIQDYCKTMFPHERAIIALGIILLFALSVAGISATEDGDILKLGPDCGDVPAPRTDIERELKRWADHIPGECRWKWFQFAAAQDNFRGPMAVIWAHLHYAPHRMTSLEEPNALENRGSSVSEGEMLTFLWQVEELHPFDHDHDDYYETTHESRCQAIFFDGICKRVFN